MKRSVMFILWLLGATAAYGAQVSIAAVVGDEIITSSDVEQRRELVMATGNIPPTVENQQKLTPRIVQSLVDEKLQLQEAKAQGQTVSDEDLAKAIDSMTARTDNKTPLRQWVASQGLSIKSLENQIRAQMAWNKVVTKKLRRNVNVSQDEVLRAQKAAVSAPGEEELRLQAIEIKRGDEKTQAARRKLAEEIALQLKSGAEMTGVAAKYIRFPEVQFNAPVWVAESNLPIGLVQGLRQLKNGELTPPLEGEKSIQIIQVLDRQVAPKQADATEYAMKQIALQVPAKPDKASLAKLRLAASKLRTDPGSCTEETVPAVDVPVEVKFVRLKLAAMNPQQRGLVSHLEVGDVSEPLPGPDALRLIVMCEKIEPSSGNLPDAEATRQKLFSEKLELEAQKHLRNLRRDAYIDIKGAN